MTRIDHPDPATAGPSTPDVLGAPSTRARALFGPQLPVAELFARLLATDGIDHGLIGPREVPRLWDRHLVNSALLADLVPVGARVVDVGSGAGLPGLAMAIRRPDLQVDAVEPMQRRVQFLTDAVAALDLGDRVRVVRGRAEEATTRRAVGDVDWVVARAVAPLERLARWCLPLLVPGGTLLAMKGSTAGQELADNVGALRRMGAGATSVLEVGSDDARTWVVSVERGAAVSGRTSRRGPDARR